MLVNEGFYYCNLYWPGTDPRDLTLHDLGSCWVELNDIHLAEQARERLDGFQFRGRSLRATLLVYPQSLFHTPRYIGMGHQCTDTYISRLILVPFLLPSSCHSLSNTAKQVLLQIRFHHQPRAHLYRMSWMIPISLVLSSIQIGSLKMENRQRSMATPMCPFPQSLPSLRLL